MGYGVFEGEPFTTGEKVNLSVDAEQRKVHAMVQIGYGQLPLGKGYHFPESSYDEYIGVIPPPERKDVIAALQVAMDKLIAADIPLKKFVRDDGVQIVSFGDEEEYPPSQPCGGTHLDSTGQIGGVLIRKIKVKKGKTRIYKAIVEAKAEL